MEAELKEIAEAKAKAEAEIKAVKAEKLKLESEIQASKQSAPTEENIEAETNTDTTDSVNESTNDSNDTHAEQSENDESANDKDKLLIAEKSIEQLLTENRLIQTYQPVIAMTEAEDEEEIEIFQTGISSFDNNEEVNDNLNNIGALSNEIQQTLTEFMLRQIFARLTENLQGNQSKRFIINVTENWFTNIALFQWLQNILTQTKKYSPGKSIIINVPMPLYIQHQKRAAALISTLHKTYQFQVAVSQIEQSDTLMSDLKSVFAKWLMLDMEVLKKLNTRKAAKEEGEKDDDDEKTENKSPLELIKEKNINIATTGIEDATLLTEAITEGTDYVIGAFVGEVQDSLSSSTSMESFELT